ncbi:MAG: hypothetical protein AAGA77_18950 [Bacteroidota bacterium]
MKGLYLLVLLSVFLIQDINAQEGKLQNLDFLIGTWETREEIADKGWWETSTREIEYTLGGNYIRLNAKSIDSNGREREYSWFINYNKNTEQFEMISMFSNWYKTQFDVLTWNEEDRTLVIQHKEGMDEEYHERYGEMTFSEDFKNYTWKGENRYGDPNDLGIWRYVETGQKIGN